MNRKTEHSSRARGKLKIGDDWNAITIIALSQTSPLKAIAELVENSIDAKARTVTITRGREHRRHFLSIRDDGEGVPRDNAGRPDFRYVATHVCDSVKRRLKAEGTSGLQGEFGIGLLSFWTVGDELSITSTGDDRRAYQMVMRKGDPTYVVTPLRALFGDGGTEVRIAPLLDGIRGLSGEKIQWYLAAELRDRIRQTGVRINVVDRLARKQYAVEPRQYEGRLLHQLPALHTRIGDMYAELYLGEPSDSNRVALFRRGTRVVEDLALLDDLAHPPWTLRCLQGHVDAPFVNLTPGTRSGLIYDTAYATLCEALQPLERKLVEVIEEQRRAEEEQASQEQLRTIQRAFREALLALPAEEYDWFDIHARSVPVETRRRDRGEFTFALARGQRSRSRGGRAGTRRGPATAVLRVRRTAFQRDGFSGIDYGAGRRGQRAAGPTARSFAAPRRARSHVPVADRRRAGRSGRDAQPSRHLPGAGRARPHACEGHGAPARRCLCRRRIDHRHSRTDGATRHRDRLVAGPAGLYVRACPRRVLALAPRCRAKRHRDQQRAPGFRLCLAQQVAETALPRPPLRQGARHAQLRRPAGGPAPGTHGGTFAANGGASLRSRFQFRVRKAADLSNENCDRAMTMAGRLSDGLRMSQFTLQLCTVLALTTLVYGPSQPQY